MTVSPSLRAPRERARQAFLLALGLAAVMFLPFLIYDKGYFIFYGDFNVQQIPFYQMAHDAVKSGNIFWSWTTDLGANFVGSYSFYLLGSPFFWLTLAFPGAVVPYLIAPLLMLKMALASLAAYGYLRRFLRADYALWGGILYAFSGFSIYNIFFNHFHEAILYLPLMLLAMEAHMEDGRHGWFALTVFFSALSNYYFFIGQAIFLMIYWIVRALSGDWRGRLGIRFLTLSAEALLGTAMAAVMLLPAYLAVIQNPRADSPLSGWGFLIYSKPQRLYDIIHSYFFPQDIPARAAFFPDSDNKWGSMSAWIPVFGCVGVVACLQSLRHTHWIRRLTVLLVIMTLIPGFNALFQLFSSMYYARWYYMLVLILILATLYTLQNEEALQVNWKRAFGWTGGVTAALALYVGLMPASWEPDEKTGKLTIGLYNHEYTELFWTAVGIAAATLVLAGLLVSLHRRKTPGFFRAAYAATAVVVVLFGWYSIAAGKMQGRFTSRYVTERAIGGAESIDLPDWGDARVDFCNDMDNMGMFWQVPTIQAFHSIVPGSIMEFYPTVGVTRSVGSRPDTSHYALRGLLSVRWLFDYANADELQIKGDNSYFTEEDSYGGDGLKMPGFSYYGEQNGFKIYSNDYYVPYGFTYDYYVTRSEYNDMDQSTRELTLMKALVLEDDDVTKYEGILESFEDSTAYFLTNYTKQGYLKDCEERRATAASCFSRDNLGFSAEINLPKENLVFFSVPYEDGWAATVNGEKAEIVKANVGFMAVKCPAGKADIRFDYRTPGLKNGAWISLAGAGAFLLYLLIALLVVRAGGGRPRHALGAFPLAESGGLPFEETDDTQPPEAFAPFADRGGEPEFDLFRMYGDKGESDGSSHGKAEERPAGESASSGDSPQEPLP